MEEWNERRWWHHIPVGCAILIAIILLTYVSTFPQESIYRLLFSLGSIVLGSCALLVWLIGDQARSYINPGVAYALYEENSHLVRAGLRKVRLAPWPFPTKYKVGSYPYSFSFSSQLHPITANPKVMSLLIRVAVTAVESARKHGVLLDYLDRFQDAQKDFSMVIFDILYQRLPQDIAGQLNPFNQETVERLRQFIAGETAGKLPFDHDVNIEVKMA